jgi:Bacterial membrane protein YfhO
MTDRPRHAALFACGAVALVGWILRDAVLHGYVLGQGDYLFDLLPWQPYRPLGWRVRMPILSDAAVAIYPFLAHARQAIASGSFPLWSAAIGAGHPFFAAAQTAVLSPFTLADYLLPFPWSLAVDAGLRLVAGGLGMYALLRAWRLSPPAAVFGGIAYLLNPFSVVWLEHPLSAAAAWLPWVLLAVQRCAASPDPRAVAGVAAASAVTVLSGHPETAFKVLMLAALFAVFAGIRSASPVRVIALTAAGMTLGAACAAVQILPFLEYASQSRALAARSATGGPNFVSPPAAFAAAFVPDFYGHPLRHRFALAGTNYLEQQIYPGLMIWLCAPLALAHRRLRGAAIFFLAAAAIAALIMYGTPVARAAVWLLPPLRVAALSRFGLLTIAGLAVAGAIGADAILAEPLRGRRRLALGVVLVATAVTLAVVVALWLNGQRELLTREYQWSSTLDAVTRGGVILLAGLVVLLAGPDLPRRVFVALPAAVLAFDLLLFADGFHPLMPRDKVFPPVPELSFVQKHAGLHRVAAWGLALPPNTASLYGLQDFRSYDGVGLRRYEEFLEVGFHFNGTFFELANAGTPHLLDFLNIKYIVTPAEVDLPADRFLLAFSQGSRVYENLRVQERAFLVDRYVVARGDDARRLLRRATDLRTTVVLDDEPPADQRPAPAAQRSGTATVTRYEDTRVEIRTETDGRRLLVLSDVYYPGWTARIDGAPAPILLANYAFRAVSVPAGTHTVVFRYQPRSVRYGALLSLLAGTVVLVLLLRKVTPLSRQSVP